ncbi:hypothetical protein BX667DRAFT_493530 [Coemansia mojavensis]|nr:hypothetical protein BX667DRAFT_493530 [Coemansia mojavensis]
MSKPPLPLGYAQRIDKETGYTFYINLVTGKSQWTVPRLSAYATSNLHPNICMVDPDTVLPPHGYYDYFQQTMAEDKIYQQPTRHSQYRWQLPPQLTQIWQQPDCHSPQHPPLQPQQIPQQPYSLQHSYIPIQRPPCKNYPHSLSLHSPQPKPKQRRKRSKSSNAFASKQALTSMIGGLAVLSLHSCMDESEWQLEDAM